MATTEEVRLIVKAEVDSVISELRKVESATKNVQKNTDDFVKSLAFMKMQFDAGVAAVRPMVEWFGKCVEAASNLEEVTNKFNVVFAGNMEIASKAVDELTNSYAMSEREAKQYLSAMQDLLVPMGMAGKKAAEMSVNIVKLSADLGSFNNLPTADVMRDIQAAMTGEFETMKKYGVILNETTIKQIAASKGIDEKRLLTDAATKSEIIYGKIVKDSAAALGDMVRTSDSYANVSKALNARLEDFQARVGTQLLSPLKELKLTLIDLTSSTSSASGGFKILGGIAGDAIRFVNSELRRLDVMINGVVYGIKQLQNGFVNTAEAQEKLAKGAIGDPEKRAQLESLIESSKKLDESTNKYKESLGKIGADDSYENQNNALTNYTNNAIASHEKIATSAKDAHKKQMESHAELMEYLGQEAEAEIERDTIKYEGLREVYAGHTEILNELDLAHSEKRGDIVQKVQQDEISKNLTKASRVVGITQQMGNTISNVMTFMGKREETRLNKDYTYKKGIIDLMIKDEQQRAQFQEALDIYMSMRKRQAARDEAVKAKAIGITMAIIGTAMAVINGLQTTPFFPLGIIMGVLAAALGAVQIGLIAAAPIPAAAEGALVQGSDMGSLVRMAEGGRSEAVLPLENERAMEKISSAIGGGATINIDFGGAILMTETVPEKIAAAIDEALYKLKRRGNSVFAESF